MWNGFKKNKKLLVVCVFSLFIFFAGHEFVFAQSSTKYNLLAPITQSYTTFDTADGCAFGRYLGIVINIALGISAVLALLMIVIGGVEYMTSELISSKQAGKEKIVNAILGLLIMLSAWLILNTINPKLLDLCLQLPEAKITIEDEPQQPTNGKYCKNPSYDAGTPWTVLLAGQIPQLPAGVLPNNGECGAVGQQSCTSLKGLNPSIINTIKSQQNCPTCHLIITGGTECWLHSINGSHKPGSATIDLRATPSLNYFLTGQYTFPTSAIVVYKAGIRFLAEQSGQTQNTTGAHWHVSF